VSGSRQQGISKTALFTSLVLNRGQLWSAILQQDCNPACRFLLPPADQQHHHHH
jgi:hypothetical protein